MHDRTDAQAAALTWKIDDGGLRFRVLTMSGQPVPPAGWGAVRVGHDAGPGSVAPLLTLLGDGGIAPDADGSLLVPHDRVAGWDRHQIAQLGLPAVAPFHLHIRGQGVLTSPAFRFQYQLRRQDGVPAMGARRQGTILTVGAKTFTLPDPVFSLIEGMERYNAVPARDMDGRFAVWGRLQALLPDDAVVDRHLRSMNITRADSMTLDVRAGDDFDPVLLRRCEPDPAARERGEAGVLQDLLPPAAQRDFAARFRRFSDARCRYAVAGNWFVMVPGALRPVLGVVRQTQEAPAAQRRAFIASPYAGIGRQLGDAMDPETIGDLFQETPAFLSQRVEKLGAWHPKLHAFVPKGMTDWFPGDPEPAAGKGTPGAGKADQDPVVGDPVTGNPVIGIPAGAGIVNVRVTDIPEILGRMGKAREADESTVVWEGQSIPVDAETVQAFERAGTPQPDRAPPLVPIIKDNLDNLQYVAATRRTRGVAGGIPAALRSTLFPHQLAGLDWLQQHWVQGSGGALLADDMGLGKTVQTLAFLSWIDEQTGDAAARQPHLIVAPTGLLKNWEAEAQQHLAEPGPEALFRAYGPDLKKLGEKSGHDRRRYLKDRARWVLTTYETLRDRIALFVDIPWQVVVFDEAQRIKNPGARVTDMAKSLEAGLTLALTGTPVENTLTDLWCIVDTVQPGLLGAHSDFKSTFAARAEADPAVLEPLQAKLERETTPPVLLRRMKEDHIKGLPRKHVHRVTHVMPPDQVAAYNAMVDKAQATTGQAGAMLGALHGLRRVSLLPDAGDEAVDGAGITDRTVQQSARLRALVDILDAVAGRGEKALVFVEFLKVQEMLVPCLRQRYGLARDPLRIHGGIPGARRRQYVDAFQEGKAGQFDVMILSPRAAGVGLTLTAANHVVHLTRWWNPAVEDQCTDRVYRIGQDRDVHVHLPLAVHPDFGEHSFDLNLDRLLQRKRDLGARLLMPPVASDRDLASLAAESITAG